MGFHLCRHMIFALIFDFRAGFSLANRLLRKYQADQAGHAFVSLINYQHHLTTNPMLPPIDDSVLRSNPRFAALHATLTNNLLNPNGTTKNQPTQKERDAVTEVLHQDLYQQSLTAYRPTRMPKSAEQNHNS
jgi:hypothetical protein